MLNEILTEQYKFEWEHRAYLLSAVNVTIVLATVVAGALVAIVRFYEFELSFASVVVAVLLGASCCALVFAAYSVFKALSGYEYARAPLPSALVAWRQGLSDWHTLYGSAEQAKLDFAEGMAKQICEATERNWQNNKRRSARVYRANVATGIAASLLVVPGLLYVMQDKMSVPKPQQVEIVGGQLEIRGANNDGE